MKCGMYLLNQSVKAIGRIMNHAPLLIYIFPQKNEKLIRQPYRAYL